MKVNSEKERFEKFVMPVPWSGCHEWMGQINRYGKFRYKGGQLAHRFSWELNYGPIPEGLHVLHRCDNPSCVRPDHLFLGTHNDNMKDKVLKGRASRFVGEAHPGAKLTWEAVEYIRSDQRVARILAEEMGVSKTTIRDIRRGEIWTRKNI